MARFENIVGRYMHVDILGREYRVYWEEAGQGIPLIVGHTAGADGREYRHVMNDPEVTKDFRVIAIDMPYHGRSLPPYGVDWWAEEYNLTKEMYIGITNNVADALELDRPVYMGSSMGGHLAIDLASVCPEKYRATIAVEGALQSATEYVDVGMAGIRKEFDNPQVSRTSTGAAMLLNMSPYSPEKNVREIQWLYSCGGPGIFAGDLYYYYYDHNMPVEEAQAIDTSKCMVYMVTGEYDPNTPPADAAKLAALIPGAKFWEMPKLGHFPMTEDYDNFRDFLLPILQEIKAL